MSASQYSNWTAGADGSDDEDELNDELYHSRETTLFLLEATPSMLAPTLVPAATQTQMQTQTQTQTQGSVKLDGKFGWKGEPATSKMEACLRAAYAMMKRKVFSAPKDCIGVVIFNTAETKGISDTSSKHCYLLQDLVQPDAVNIRALKDLLIKCEEDPLHLSHLLAPNPGQNVVADSFGFCNTIFRSRSAKLADKSILLVTDNDDPVGDSGQLRDVAMNKRKDLADSNQELLACFTTASSSEPFDVNKFWGDVITMESEDASQPEALEDLGVALGQMLIALRTQSAQKRIAFSVPFTLAEGLIIGVNAYGLVGEEKKRPPVKVDLNTAAGEEVIAKTIYKDAESGEPLDPKKEIKKYFQVGKSDFESGVPATKVFFDEAEIRKIKTLGRAPGLRLIGFKDRDKYLRFEETVKHSYFIYPSETTYSGSTRAFVSLQQTMLDKNKIGFGVLLARANARPQMVVMIPQDEELNEYGMQVTAPGIHLCQLPFADDIRPLDIEVRASIVPRTEDDDDEYVRIPAVEEAKAIIKQLTKTYHPNTYPNPALNHFYNTLAAVALDEDASAVEVDDQTVPQYALIDKKVGHRIRALKALINEDEMDTTKVHTSNKRRKIDVDPNAPVADASEFVNEFKERGAKMLVAQLKDGLKLLGCSVSGKKDDLVQRVKDALKKRGEGEDDDDEDDDSPPAKKSNKVNRVKSEDEDDPMSDDERKPKSSGKGSSHKKRSSADSMDEDDF